MADFGIRFFICNIFICFIISIFLILKQVLRNHLTSRIQFNLWFLLLGLLTVPFIPVRPVISSLLDMWKNAASPNMEIVAETAANIGTSGTAGQINDLALSVSSRTPSVIGLILFWIWMTGIFAMLLLVTGSKKRLNTLKKSALPLQNREVRISYSNCLSELNIKRDIPIYSTAFLKSPVIVGLFRPCIYLPIHLINFAEKISLSPFPFAAFSLIAVMLLGLTPMLSTYTADQSCYKWNISPEKIDLIDLSAYFGRYEGSFVLYDLKSDSWDIYDMDHATFRTSPSSTYKIYDTLFGLEEGIITPRDSLMAWNGTDYPFEAWNADQDLYSAMESSVNWYFQKIDEQLGAAVLRNYVKKIGYGNENIDPDLSSYWMQSTANAATLRESAHCLTISPVEQVLLLTDLYNNDFGFTPENVNTVKDSICLFSSDDRSFYGKTGTGRVDGQDVNGWFVGFVEKEGNTYFFATNIQNDANATGSNAAEITKTILSELDIWK